MGFISDEQAKRFSAFPGVHHVIYASRELGSESTTLGVVTIDPGAEVPLHHHNVEDCMVVLEGEAEFTIDGVTTVVRAGSGVIAPAKSLHSVRNVGEGPFRVCFTWPSVEVDRVMDE